MDDDQDLSEEERRALRALPVESPLPARLEDRVVAALRRRGLIAARPIAPRFMRLAAAAALFAAGVGTGALARPAPKAAAPKGTLYLLLLYPGPAFSPGGPAEEAARVEEYRAWAGALAREGKLSSAERLRAGARVFEGATTSSAVEGPQGFFVVRARDREEAETIARACPHLRHGGRVAVQAVDPT